jgi:hypothetical protein
MAPIALPLAEYATCGRFHHGDSFFLCLFFVFSPAGVCLNRSSTNSGNRVASTTQIQSKS